MNILSALRAIIINADIATSVSNRVYPYGDPGVDVSAFPYITIMDYVDEGIRTTGDADVISKSRTIQVSLWQKTADEDDNLIEQLMDAVDRANLADTDTKTLRVRVLGVTRIVERDTAVVQHALT